MTEELTYCSKCKELESFLYNDFEEVVSYVHCKCKKKLKPLTGERKPLDLAFDVLEQFLKEEKIK